MKSLSPVKSLFAASVGVLGVAYAQCYYEVTKLCHNNHDVIGSVSLPAPCFSANVEADGDCYGSNTTTQQIAGQQGRSHESTKACDCLGRYFDCSDMLWHPIQNFPSSSVTEKYPNPNGQACT
jgi:hypothetical protein